MTSPDFQSGTDRIAARRRRTGEEGSPRHQHPGRRTHHRPPRSSTSWPDASHSDAALEMVTAASVMTDPAEITNPNCVKVVLAKNGDALYFSRSVIPHPFGLAAGASPGVVYHRHQGIYGYERRFLARFVRWEPSATNGRNGWNNCAPSNTARASACS